MLHWQLSLGALSATEIGSQLAFGIFKFFGLDAPAGTTSTAVDAGYYLLLAPLSVGRHALQLTGALDPLTPDDESDDVVIDTTFNITVTRH